MRNRTRPDEQRERSQPRDAAYERGGREVSGRGREQTGREQSGREATNRVRVPKIQYRFLKELEEKGVSGDVRMGALSMADKIRRYPLEDRAVMGSWERFTKTAIEEFKNGTGRADERDRQHLAYAVLFSAMRDKEPARNVGELKQRIEAVSARRPPTRGQDREQAAPRDEQPRQQDLLEPERAQVERQIDRSIEVLRTLTPELRATIEATARSMIAKHDYTRQSARAMLPAAFKDLRQDPSERNTIDVLSLAVVAAAPHHRVLLIQGDSLERDARLELEADTKARVQEYASRPDGLWEARNDAAQATVRYTLSPSPESRREALVHARAHEEMECKANPRRIPWQNVADELSRVVA